MASWNVGDVVRLKSGGPAMTITKDMGTGRFQVEWFGQDGKRGGDTFPGDALDEVPTGR
jgi:uncharacterized protein YodC (DUF2158 family)